MTLINTNEVLRRCKVSRRTLLRWAHGDGFPGVAGKEPVPDMKTGSAETNLYDWGAVREFLISRGQWDLVIDVPDIRAGIGRRKARTSWRT